MNELTKADDEMLNSPVFWNPELLQEVILNSPDDFLKIKETLTRIGITVRGEKTLNQSCHILHKRGKYYIVSFLEVFALDGKTVHMKLSDVARRNSIASMLEMWGLCKIKHNEKNPQYKLPFSSLKVVSHKDKSNWRIVSRCSLGK